MSTQDTNKFTELYKDLFEFRSYLCNVRYHKENGWKDNSPRDSVIGMTEVILLLNKMMNKYAEEVKFSEVSQTPVKATRKRKTTTKEANNE